MEVMLSEKTILALISTVLLACFNIATGDVEDAPALDPLSKYEIVQKDGAVYIKGEEATIKANRRVLNVRCSAKSSEKVLVIGGLG